MADILTGFNTNEFASYNLYSGCLDGGEAGLTNDPLIKGHAYLRWTNIPSWVLSQFPKFKEITAITFKGLDGLTDQDLETEGITSGFNANEYHVAKGITKQNVDITLKFQEWSGSPIASMFGYWVSGIRDPETGLATYVSETGGKYGAANHTGELLYVVTRPDAHNFEGDNIEFACYWTNVFPKRIALSQWNYSIGDKGQVELDMPLVGNFHRSEAITKYAYKVMKATRFQFRAMGDFKRSKSGAMDGGPV